MYQKHFVNFCLFRPVTTPEPLTRGSRSVPGDCDFVDRGSNYIRSCDLGAPGRND